MKSSVEVLEDNKVKVYVEVEEHEFDRDIDAAFKAIAKEIKLPGFRNGKVPRKVLEARIGVGPAREQALRDAVPTYLAKAVREHDVDLIATPEVEITDGHEDGPVEFDATCEVRPVVTVPGYAGLRVEVPSIEVSDDELAEARAEQLREHGDLVDLDRPIEEGDYVVLDLEVTRDGEELPGLNTDGWSYEVGQGWVAEGFDEQLIGASAGDRLEFAATPKGTEGEADFVVTVTRVQQLVEAEATDEWVRDELVEFDTVDEWEEHLRTTLADRKLSAARQAAGPKLNEALAELVDLEPPAAMVDSEVNQRVQGLVQQFQAQGIDLQQWLQATGQEPQQLVESMRPEAETAVKVDLALRAVAAAEEIDVTDDDLEAEYARMAMRYQQKAKDIRRLYEQNDAVPELVAQIRKAKAFDWLVHHADYVDETGAAVDRDTLIGHTHDDAPDDHDRPADDHDHPAHPSDEAETAESREDAD